MKIYFDGCSFTWGAELEHPKKERYSRLICNDLGAEETNLSTSGGSNDRIVRNLLIENNIEEYDLAIIQMTFPVRTEYWEENKNRWVRVNPKWNYARWCLDEREDWNDSNPWSRRRNPFYPKIDKLEEKFVDHGEHWKYYYKHIHTGYYSQTKENIQSQTIRNHCKAHNVPVILLTINGWSKVNFDYTVKLNSKTRVGKGHPNKLGHEVIASNLLSIWKK